MPVINVKMEVTNEELADLTNGNSKLMGLIKDSDTNKIQRHVPLVDEDSASTMDKVLLGLGIATFILKIGEIILGEIAESKKKKLEQKQKTINDYNESASNYLIQSQKGTLTLKDIKQFSNCINVLVEQDKTGSISIEISEEELNALVNILTKFTKAICDANGYSFAKEECLDNQYVAQLENKKKLESVKELLFIQEEVYSNNK